MYCAAITLFAALIIPHRLAAQNNQDHNNGKKHHHYLLIDMGTFGGALSSINFAVDDDERAVNQRGVIVGWSATSVPKSPYSRPLICGGDDGFGTFITHAFRWQDGTITDLGALAPSDTNCSNADQVNANGEVAAFSEKESSTLRRG